MSDKIENALGEIEVILTIEAVVTRSVVAFEGKVEYEIEERKGCEMDGREFPFDRLPEHIREQLEKDVLANAQLKWEDDYGEFSG